MARSKALKLAFCCRRLPALAAITLLCVFLGNVHAITGVELTAWPVHTDAFAVLHSQFFRSAAMYCREVEVSIGMEGRHSFHDFITGFSESPPSTGLALHVDVLESSPSQVNFEVLEAVGPWHERIGQVPMLQRVKLTQHEGTEPRYHCSDLSLRGDGEADIPVTLSLDTSKAYNWLRFPGHLDWARHIINAVRSSSAGPDSSPPLCVDLGSGSGWMGILLKAHLSSGCDVMCTDISSDALSLVRADAATNKLKVLIGQGDMMQPVARHGRLPKFVYFNPPQVSQSKRDKWAVGPDMAVYTSEDGHHFHKRFCEEVKLSPGGVAWLVVVWEILPDVVSACCASGWQVRPPAGLKDITSLPYILLELQRDSGSSPSLTEEECSRVAMRDLEDEADYLARAVNAESPRQKVSMYQKAAERGVPAAQANLGLAYAEGYGVARNMDSARAWLTAAAEAGHEDAQQHLGQLLAKSALWADAERWFLQAAQHGHARAAADLGFMRVAGQGTEQNLEEGLFWLSRAANQGNVRALCTLGDSYANGVGMPQDDTQALGFYQEAAMQGDVPAMTMSGIMYAQGRGVAVNMSAAAHWFRRAAEAGGENAQLNLGTLYENGEGVDRDEEAAAFWYKAAASQGSAPAALQLASLYFESEGMRDLAEGMHWLQRAVEQGYPDAQEVLSTIEAAASEGDEDARIALASRGKTALGAFRHVAAPTLTRPALPSLLAGVAASFVSRVRR